MATIAMQFMQFIICLFTDSSYLRQNKTNKNYFLVGQYLGAPTANARLLVSILTNFYRDMRQIWEWWKSKIDESD